MAGPDHALWFAENQGNSIGRITTGGTVTEMRLPARRHPSGMAVGPDGALWVVEDDGAWRGVGRLTTAGRLSEYTLPIKGGAPQMLVAGVGGDHHLYVTLVKANAIIRITPSVGGAAPRMERMSLPAPVLPAGQSAGSSYNPYAIAPALGGIWFSEEGFNILGRLGPDGHVGEYYAFGGNNLQNTFPSIIARAPDGTLWFTASDANASNNRIVHLTGVPSEIDNNG